MAGGLNLSSVAVVKPGYAWTFDGANLTATPFQNSSSASASKIYQSTDNGGLNLKVTEMYQDSNGQTFGSYGTLGTNLSQSSIDAVFQVVSDYVTATPTNSHGGIGLNYTDGNNWDTLCLLCVQANSGTNGILQIRDRTNGVEFISDIILTNHTTSFTNWYRLRIDQLTNQVSQINLWDITGGGSQWLNNYTRTAHVGVPTSGYALFHTASEKTLYKSILVYDGSGNVICSSANKWVEGYPSQTGKGGFVVSGNVLTRIADGTADSINTWSWVASPVFCSDCTMKGFIKRTSGRMAGVSFRQSNSGTNTYAIIYDNNNTDFRLWNVNGLTITEITPASSSVTLTQNVDYPFTLTVRGTNFTFTCNNKTFTTGDTANTYSSGFVGVAGFQGQASYHDVQIFP